MAPPAPLPPSASELADRATRLAAAGAVGASVAHELRNALAVVSSSLFLAQRDRRDEARLSAHLDKAVREVNRAQSVVSAVLGLARGEALRCESTPVAALVDAARGSVVLPTNVTLSVRLDPPELSALGDPVLLERLLSNLLLNAVEALAGRGRGAVEVRASSADGWLEIAVEDDGPGVDPAVAPHMFDPLVTNKPQGTGLGLALVRAVARAHGGEAEAGHRDGSAGTRVVVRLPV